MAITDQTASRSNSQNFATGTLTNQDDFVQIRRFTTWAYVAIQLTGTWTGTVTFETTVDQVTWVTLSVTPSNSTTTATTATANGVWTTQIMGYAAVRARFTTASSGSVSVTMKALQSQF